MINLINFVNSLQFIYVTESQHEMETVPKQVNFLHLPGWARRL